VLGEAAADEGFHSEAERLLRRAAEGLEATCSFFHHDALRVFARHQRVSEVAKEGEGEGDEEVLRRGR